VEGVLIDGDPHNAGQSHHTENRNGFVLVLATAHENRKGSRGHHQKDHPEMEVLVYPKSGGDDRKQGKEYGRQ